MRPDALTAAVEAAFAGDPDDLVDLMDDDVVVHDQPGEPPVAGAAAVHAHFMAYAGRRARARVHDLFIRGDRGGVAWTVWFRADAHAYGQHGRALLALDPGSGRITQWDGAWVELDSDLSPWAGD